MILLCLDVTEGITNQPKTVRILVNEVKIKLNTRNNLKLQLDIRFILKSVEYKQEQRLRIWFWDNFDTVFSTSRNFSQ